MLNITWVEFFTRGIPESLVIMWGIYVISKKTIDKYKYLIGSISIASVTFLIRLLPIHLGIHIIINNVFTVCVAILIGVSLIKAIYSTIFTTLLLLVGELVNAVLFSLLKVNIGFAFKSGFMKCLYTLPSLIFLTLSILLIRFLLNKREGVKIVHD